MVLLPDRKDGFIYLWGEDGFIYLWGEEGFIYLRGEDGLLPLFLLSCMSSTASLGTVGERGERGRSAADPGASISRMFGLSASYSAAWCRSSTS